MDPIAPAFDPPALASRGAGRRSSSSAFTWSVLSLCYFGDGHRWTSISCSSVRPSETLVSPCVLWPLTPAVSLGDMGNCADDQPQYIYHCHMFIYGSSWSRVSWLWARPLASFSIHCSSISTSWLFSASHSSLLSFLIPLFPSVLVILLTLPLTIYSPRHHWLPTTPLSHRPCQGGLH